MVTRFISKTQKFAWIRLRKTRKESWFLKACRNDSDDLTGFERSPKESDRGPEVHKRSFHTNVLYNRLGSLHGSLRCLIFLSTTSWSSIISKLFLIQRSSLRACAHTYAHSKSRNHISTSVQMHDTQDVLANLRTKIRVCVERLQTWCTQNIPVCTHLIAASSLSQCTLKIAFALHGV